MKLPTFAESFKTGSLPCFSFAGRQLCGYSVIENMILLLEDVLMLDTFFTDETLFDFSEHINSQISGICSAENPRGKQ